MTELIPRLIDLCFNGNRFHVKGGFAENFVKLHHEDWRTAQDHWERIVVRVLNTDAIDLHASQTRAMFQGVAAAAILLSRTDLRDHCPLCRPARVLLSEGSA